MSTRTRNNISAHEEHRPSPNEARIMFAYAEMEKHRTNHILHLLLSFITLGLWLIPWLAVSIRNTQQRNRIARDYGLPGEINIGYIIIFFLLLSSIGGYQVYSRLLGGTHNEAANMMDGSAAQQPQPETHWIYAKTDSPMGPNSITTATTYSQNEIEFGPPYEGKQRGTLILRKNFDNSHNVYLGLQKGRFKCDNRDCGITARFDNGLEQYFEATPVKNESTPGIYILNADIFIQLAEEANTLTIKADFFDQPSQVFQFDIMGLTLD